jgi:hypothetical protein
LIEKLKLKYWKGLKIHTICKRCLMHGNQRLLAFLHVKCTWQIFALIMWQSMPLLCSSHKVTCIEIQCHKFLILLNLWKCISRDVPRALIKNAQNLQHGFDQRQYKDLLMPLCCFLQVIPFQCNKLCKHAQGVAFCPFRCKIN